MKVEREWFLFVFLFLRRSDGLGWFEHSETSSWDTERIEKVEERRSNTFRVFEVNMVRTLDMRQEQIAKSLLSDIDLGLIERIPSVRTPDDLHRTRHSLDVSEDHLLSKDHKATAKESRIV